MVAELKKHIRVLICIGCFVLLIISWLVVMNSKSTAEKQLILINRATELMSDGIFIRAVPLLEEAAGFEASHTKSAESELKRAYLELIDKRGFPRRYTTLLDKQMNRRDAEPYIFIEAAVYYLNNSKTQEALEVLKNGIKRTGDINIISLYENSRYAFEISRMSYEYMTEIFEKTVQVQVDGKWGIINDEGFFIIPCQYDKTSNFSEDRVVVRNGSSIYAVDMDNNRIAVPYETVSDFGNFSENRISLLIDGYWHRATGEFEVGEASFEDIGMYSGGYAAAKTNGGWGVIDISNNWLIPSEFDDIIRDELGRCYAQGSVFFRDGDFVRLFVNGNYTEFVFDDARPFSDEGFAAVKKNNKWGFIDTDGVEVIPFSFDDALSFGQHLAAVKLGEFWGYININGNIVIDTIFLNAKSFSEGSAPVLTDRGWQILTLLEYKRRGSL